MKKSLLLTVAAILLFGIIQQFNGQETTQSHRHLPLGGKAVIEQQRRMAQPPFLLNQESNRWMNEQTLPYQQRMTRPIGHRDYRTNTMMTGKTLTKHELSAGVDTAWVRHYASGLARGEDWAKAMAVDSFGNVYVTGYSSVLPFGVDYFTVKYGSSGVQVWSARYDGGGNSDDLAVAICADALGNIYVTGTSASSTTGWDYTTVKYNSTGVQQWVARYNGPGNGTEEATALALDASGNVYVTGWSEGSGTGFDYATVKYNAAGVQQWVARYNGPENSDDEATALTVDGSGNVYVTGSSDGFISSYFLGRIYIPGDYVTVKYNSSGVEQWVARYSGPGNFSDEATALAVDNSGNVYVTGRSDFYYVEEIWSVGGNYATVKYDPSGVEQWVARYGEGMATDLALDASANVYVTGTSWDSVTNSDYATVKYNSDGAVQWVARYNGPENGWDEATDLALDASGNVYVTGGSEGDFVTVKYNSAGVEQWIARGPGTHSAIALAVDASGNVYVTGTCLGSSTRPDYATVKYDSTGAEKWVARYNGPGNSYEGATALAVDVSGNVYVTGRSQSSRTGSDYATVKYDSDGIEQWIKRYSGEGYSHEDPSDLAVDASGNVYVTGNAVTIKYNRDGVRQWRAFSDGRAIAVDASGNVYVLLPIFDAYGTVKYNSDGIQQWEGRYQWSGNGRNVWNEAADLAVDASGNVYVTGQSWDSGTAFDYATVKYDSAGVEQWVARYIGLGISDDGASDLALDASGNVYVTGGSEGDYVTIKYSSAGVEQWIACYNGPGNSDDGAIALAVDVSGNVYVTGGSLASGTELDYATIKYDSAGEEQWVARYNGPGNGWDEATDLALDASGNVYVMGTSSGDYATIKYNSAGVEQWIARYNGPGNGRAIALTVDASGNVYVTGTSDGYGWSVYTTIKYVQTPVLVEQEEPCMPNHYWLTQNYPNPFNLSTTFEFALPKSAFVTLKVYNLLGEEVATLIAEQRSAGIHKFNWDARGLASGVYLYRLEAGNPLAGFPNKSGQAGQGFVQVRKLILMR